MSNKSIESQVADAQCVIQDIYTKNVSFKSLLPVGTPRSKTPKAHVKVNISNAKVEQSIYEVVLEVSVQAESGTKEVCYSVEFCQAGLFQIESLMGAELEMQLYVGCPEILFAYVRELMDSLLTRGGFQPLMMITPDFNRLHSALKTHQKQATEPDLWSDMPEKEPTTH